MHTASTSLNFYVLVLCCLGAVVAETYYVGPTRDITDPSQVQLNSGDTMILDDDVYNTTFGVPSGLTGVTIASASGNPYACQINGQGGTGSGHPLTSGKGALYTQSPITVYGIGFINGGGADGVADGEAGLYAELFDEPATLTVINCAFDGNENGVFIPNYMYNGANVTVHLIECVFSKESPNGVTPDGASHNFYIQAMYLYTTDCTHMPSEYGNNIKSRSLHSNINDLFNLHDQGRCLDIPDGGYLTVTNGVYVSVGPSGVSNFMEYAQESSKNGVFPPTTDSMTIVVARNNDAIWNYASGMTWTFTNANQQWTDTSLSLHFVGSIAGLDASAPAGTVAVPEPTPIFPDWVDSPVPYASYTPGSSTSSGSTTGAPSDPTATPVPATPVPATAAPTSAPSGSGYIGCYEDSATRDLPYDQTDYSPSQTIEACRSACSQLNYAYAGLQDGNQCFCGNSYGSLGESNNCNMQCSGNSDEICGGPWANSVYTSVNTQGHNSASSLRAGALVLVMIFVAVF